MNRFPDGITFVYKWRKYQQRVIESLNEHLQNKHLHLIAPPGSGKTVLGLEVMLRINGPTLILAPTLAIKNQWLDRFLELFLQEKEMPDWISMKLSDPKFLTITTYQALHSAVANQAGEEEDGDIIPEGTIHKLEMVGFRTLIMDEAHHLRASWWKSTLTFRKCLENPTMVALTATPPYDVSFSEWQRYIELCGPIDLEISVPELMLEEDLCPHQDYVFMSTPSKVERDIITEYRDEIKSFKDDLVNNQKFITVLLHHPWIEKPELHLEELLADPAYFSSLLIFLNEAKDLEWKDYEHILGTNKKSLPKLDFEWLEVLLSGFLFKDTYTMSEDEVLIKELKKRLSRAGAIERRKVQLESTNKVDRMLLTSASKLSSMAEIVAFESGALKERLRMVILTDYIRMEDMPKTLEDEKPLSRLGVIPIFELLRRKKMEGVKLGVLCGAIAILPKEGTGPLQELIQKESMDKEDIRVMPLLYDDAYVTLEMKGAHNQQLVKIMTALFTAGEIHVLTGTTALLGEGWDAPSINSMILASYVGSFMLSNQMRGRAIRVERGNEAKTSTIWHLVCIDSTDETGGYDMATLTRRFKGFVGVSYDGKIIENGMERIGFPRFPIKPGEWKESNMRMKEHARDRHAFKSHWQHAIDRSEGQKMVEEIAIEPEVIPKSAIFPFTIKALLLQAVTVGLFTFYNSLEVVARSNSLKGFFIILLFALFISVLVTLPRLIKGLWLRIRYGTVEASAKEIGETVLHTLHQGGQVKTDIDRFTIQAEDTFKNGVIHFWVEGGTKFEQVLLLQSVQEIHLPINNPRYLIKRESSFGPFASTDYHAVPEEIGRNKQAAEHFHRQWSKRIGKAELIYTRTLEGRKELLKARTNSLSAKLTENAERFSVWR